MIFITLRFMKTSDPIRSVSKNSNKTDLNFVQYAVRYKQPKRSSEMQRLILDKDIKPMSEFRAHTAAFIQQVQKSKRPVVITQHGKSAAILIDVSEFESMSQRLELLEDIAMGESMIDEGKGIPHNKAKEMILKRIAG